MNIPIIRRPSMKFWMTNVEGSEENIAAVKEAWQMSSEEVEAYQGLAQQ